MSTERAPEGRDSGPAGGSARGAPNQTLALAAMLFAVSMTFIDQTSRRRRPGRRAVTSPRR
ncbi:hypothetical protein ACH46N_23655 [Streptomyces pristinaespiralis]|nr:hypothetical protein [Streptomyces pristinaespiralis]QMU18833.1 hypothetical protein H3L99_16620 [Streptomyces pristinaespiralis]